MMTVLAEHLREDMDLYDVGCGEKPFADFLRGRVARHVGVDVDYGFYDASHIDLVGSADDLPISDNSADAILSSQVIEHLPDPIASFRESFRALKPGGLFFLSYPFLYPIHAVPYDFCRMTRFAVERELLDSGFEDIDIQTLGGFWYLVATLSAIYVQGLPPVRKLRLARPAAFLIRSFCGLLHRAEGASLRLMRKDVAKARQAWAVTYVVVARKPAEPAR